MELLEIAGLSTSFTTRSGVIKAVDNVSLSLRKGRVLGLVGESGCGKTMTALSLLAAAGFSLVRGETFERHLQFLTGTAIGATALLVLALGI